MCNKNNRKTKQVSKNRNDAVFTFTEDDPFHFEICKDGECVLEIYPQNDKNTDEDRGMVACIVDALNKEQE